MSKSHYKSEPAQRPEAMKNTTKPKVPVAIAQAEVRPLPLPVSHDAVQVLAYLKWEAAGRPDGNDVDHWLAAEQELQGSN